jgi:hypothetical protein
VLHIKDFQPGKLYKLHGSYPINLYSGIFPNNNKKVCYFGINEILLCLEKPDKFDDEIIRKHMAVSVCGYFCRVLYKDYVGWLNWFEYYKHWEETLGSFHWEEL